MSEMGEGIRMNANEAALTMTEAEYRLWWYAQVNVTPPFEGEWLTVRQQTDERLIHEGYYYRRLYNTPKTEATTDKEQHK
jgi:hypothetical protein